MSNAPKIGHDRIDNQHSELYDLTCLLDQALSEHSLSKVDEIIRFLEAYVIAHFNEEETLMRDKFYIHYHYHKEEHDIFKSKVAVLRQRFDRDASFTHMIFFIRELLDDLITHVNHVDIDISELTEVQTDE